MVNRATTLIVWALLVVFIPTAATARTVARPGYSGVNEYLETVPTSKGNSAGVAPKNKPYLTQATAEKLASLGPAGRATKRLAESSAQPYRSVRRGSDLKRLPRQPMALVVASTLIGTGFIPVSLAIGLIVLLGAPLVRKFGERKNAP